MSKVQTLTSVGAPGVHSIKSSAAKPAVHTPLKWTLPPSGWTPSCHPKVNEVTEQVDGYFLKHWPFPNEHARKVFRSAEFSRVTCLYFPLAKDDRIQYACRLLTILFLIDDLLEHMSFEDGEAYNENLIPIARGDVQPDYKIPVEWMMYDLWESMRLHDRELANEVLEPAFLFMRAQTDRVRLEITELGQYLEYREKDVGKVLLSALMRFAMDIHFTPAEHESMSALEHNCSKHISVVNDVYSWGKELKAAQTGHSEGSALCSAVKVVADKANIRFDQSQRVLWSMVREWEVTHDELAAQRLEAPDGTDPRVRDYIQGLQYQMSGNELWSKTTLRYSEV